MALSIEHHQAVVAILLIALSPHRQHGRRQGAAILRIAASEGVAKMKELIPCFPVPR